MPFTTAALNRRAAWAPPLLCLGITRLLKDNRHLVKTYGDLGVMMTIQEKRHTTKRRDASSDTTAFPRGAASEASPLLVRVVALKGEVSSYG